MKNWKYRNTSKYPQYCHIMETSRHVNRFPAQGARDRWDKSVLELKMWMDKQHSHPSLMKRLVARLSEWIHRRRRLIMEKRSGNPKIGTSTELYPLGSAFERSSVDSVERNTAPVLLVPGKQEFR
jgi:hypothetical protein